MHFTGLNFADLINQYARFVYWLMKTFNLYPKWYVSGVPGFQYMFCGLYTEKSGVLYNHLLLYIIEYIWQKFYRSYFWNTPLHIVKGNKEQVDFVPIPTTLTFSPVSMGSRYFTEGVRGTPLKQQYWKVWYFLCGLYKTPTIISIVLMFPKKKQQQQQQTED